MVFHTVPRCSLKTGLKFFHRNVFRFLSHPFLLLSICMTKLNDFILRNKSAERSATSIFCNVEPGACLRTVQRRRGRGKGTPGKLGWGCVLGYQKVSTQSRHTYWDKQKKKMKKKSHPNIQTKFHTKTKIEKLLHQWQNSDQNGWKHLPFGVAQTYMAQNKCIIGVTEGPNLPPSLLLFLASFLWSFFDCEILRNVLYFSLFTSWSFLFRLQ